MEVTKDTRKEEMFAKYDAYLKTHREAVRDCYKLLTGLNLNIYMPDGSPCGHDASKYSKEEYEAYAEYFYPSDGSKVGADPDRKDAFDKAWLHHQKCNPHHWQYYVLINDNDGIQALRMPLLDVYEMVSDWGAFAYLQKDGDKLRNWYAANRDKQIINKSTRKYVDSLVEIMAGLIDERFKTHCEKDN